MDEIERDMQTERSRMEMGGVVDQLVKTQQTPIEQQASRLEQALQGLEYVLQETERRISMVLSPVPEIEPEDYRVMPDEAGLPVSDLAIALGTSASHVAYLADKMRRLNDRIEL